MANIVDPDETAHLDQVSALVYRAESIKIGMLGKHKADDSFLIFPLTQKVGVDISCSPWELYEMSPYFMGKLSKISPAGRFFVCLFSLSF